VGECVVERKGFRIVLFDSGRNDHLLSICFTRKRPHLNRTAEQRENHDCQYQT
jgi:hypothetical protein